MNNYDPIPETVNEALNKWDKGDSVFSVEMGGLGPGYEMAIQGLAFEFMRHLELLKSEDWKNDEVQKRLQSELDAISSRLNKESWGGFSGAQVGAAKSLAACVVSRGYREALRDEAVKERLIQVSKKDLREASPVSQSNDSTTVDRETP